MYDFSEYVTWDKGKLLTRLAEVVSTIATEQQDLVSAKKEELQARKVAWQNNPENSVNAREHFMKYSVAHYTTTVWEVEAEIFALTEEKWLLVRLIDGQS